MELLRSRPPGAFSPRRELLVCSLMVLCTLAIYGQTATHGFLNFDDRRYVSENPHVQGGLAPGNLVWAFTTGHCSNWHPLTWLSHMLDCQFLGLRPGAHHLTSVALHLANALLLYLALKLMTGSRRRRRARAPDQEGVFTPPRPSTGGDHSCWRKRRPPCSPSRRSRAS